MTQVQPIPAEYTTITPHLVVHDAQAAIEFYQRAFGAELRDCLKHPQGQQVVHASMKIGNAMIMLNQESRDCGQVSPTSLGGSPVSIHLYVENADAFFEKAVLAGATIQMPITEMFWGDRFGTLKDPFGHQWSVATHVKDLSEAEILKGMESCMAQPAAAK